MFKSQQAVCIRKPFTKKIIEGFVNTIENYTVATETK